MKATKHYFLNAAMQDLDNFITPRRAPDHLPATTTQTDLETRLRQAETEYTEYCQNSTTIANRLPPP